MNLKNLCRVCACDFLKLLWHVIAKNCVVCLLFGQCERYFASLAAELVPAHPAAKRSRSPRSPEFGDRRVDSDVEDEKVGSDFEDGKENKRDVHFTMEDLLDFHHQDQTRRLQDPDCRKQRQLLNFRRRPNYNNSKRRLGIKQSSRVSQLEHKMFCFVGLPASCLDVHRLSRLSRRLVGVGTHLVWNIPGWESKPDANGGSRFTFSTLFHLCSCHLPSLPAHLFSLNPWTNFEFGNLCSTLVRFACFRVLTQSALRTTVWAG